jgi:hypothetical protein
MHSIEIFPSDFRISHSETEIVATLDRESDDKLTFVCPFQ